MKRPQHSDPQQPRVNKNEKFWAHAPYNFVPLPDRVVEAQPRPDQDHYREGLSGWMQVDLETCSPTYVRGMLTPEQFEELANVREEDMTDAQKEARAAFFSMGDGTVDGYPKPRIPGSSLRGMVRQLVEIVTYSKPEFIADDRMAFRGVGDPTNLRKEYSNLMMGSAGKKGKSSSRSSPIRGGYMEREGRGWGIRPAKTINGATYTYLKDKVLISKLSEEKYRWEKCQNAYKIYIATREQRIVKATHVKEPGLHAAVLVISGSMTGKNSEAVIFEPDNNARTLPVPDELIYLYRKQITPKQKILLGSDDGVLQEKHPVFYALDENGAVVFFGHCRMFRIPYSHSILDYVPAHLRREEITDMAQAIFGAAPRKGQAVQDGWAGRVFFEDAEYQSAAGEVWKSREPVTLHVLSSPKPTTFQHYLVQDREMGHDPDDKNALATYNTDPAETQIRGYKLYWTRGSDPNIIAEDIESNQESQHTCVRPLMPGVKFRFRIRFENLHPEELGALLWALTLPGPTGRQYRHRLGMGKPLGMGVVSLSTQLYVEDRKERYSRLFDGDGWYTAAREEDVDGYIRSFERYILKDQKIAPDRDRLCEVERIQDLLTLLEWREGTDAWKYWTGYMQLNTQINEFRQRPVLPTPSGVVRQAEGRTPAHQDQPGPARGQDARRRSERSTGPAGEAPAAAPAPASPEPRQESDSPRASIPPDEPGSPIHGNVDFIDDGDVYFELVRKASGKFKHDGTGRIRREKLGGKQYREGDHVSCVARAWVEEHNEWFLECEPPGASEWTGTLVDPEEGWVQPDGSQARLRVQQAQREQVRAWSSGQRVCFWITKAPKGLEASSLRKAG